MAKLTPKQQRFVDEYLIDLNATQAAIRAGYSPKYADREGHRLVENSRVSAAISLAMAERSRRTGVSADRVLQELAKIAFVNAADVIGSDGSLQNGARRDDTAAIQSIKLKAIPTEDGVVFEREVRLYDKIRALELLARHLGLFNDKLQMQMQGRVIIVDDIGCACKDDIVLHGEKDIE